MKLHKKALLAAAAASVAGLVTAAALRAGKQRRLARYYMAFLGVTGIAVGHYQGTLCALWEIQKGRVLDAATVTAALERPPVQLDDLEELHCDITATVQPYVDLARLYFTISGPTDVVTYLYRRLMLSQALGAETVQAPRVIGGLATVTITMFAYEQDNPAVVAVASALAS